MTTKRPVLFYDGYCNLCNRTVGFILRHDRMKQFVFLPLQSDEGKAALREVAGISPDSILLQYEGALLVKSDAVLMIARLLGGIWRICYPAILLPKSLRDWLYDLIARNRYRWFGRSTACALPPDLLARETDKTPR